MSDSELAARIAALHPKNAVRILEVVRNTALGALSEAAAAEADDDLQAFAQALQLPAGWQRQSVTALPPGAEAGPAADPGGEAAKALLKLLAEQPELRPLIEEKLALTDQSASLTLALGLPLAVAAAWLLVSGRIHVTYSRERGLEVEYQKEGLTPDQQAKLLPGFVKEMLAAARAVAGLGSGGAAPPVAKG
ncbi:hypothetical protein [Siccirubricoccus phaeus]|uniref:hypothetical protein n=1 Tax=Siccirubricoccus phaeus TaxID=2595053 RepID=UPI0011F1C9B0|nr:hypothetical protein [Siccirubricoccus phaeus]